MPESREDSVYLAKLADQAEQYEGMRVYSCVIVYDANRSPQRWWRTRSVLPRLTRNSLLRSVTAREARGLMRSLVRSCAREARELVGSWARELVGS